MLGVAFFNAMPIVVMLSVILSLIMASAVILSVVILSVVILSECCYAECRYAECLKVMLAESVPGVSWQGSNSRKICPSCSGDGTNVK